MESREDGVGSELDRGHAPLTDPVRDPNGEAAKKPLNYPNFFSLVYIDLDLLLLSLFRKMASLSLFSSLIFC